AGMGGALPPPDSEGRVRMVDVGGKRIPRRTAVARGRVFMHRDTLRLLRTGRTPKGNVLATAHLAGVMAAKRTAELVPLAHPLPLERIEVAFSLDDESASVGIESHVACRGRTGVELEALTAAMISALTLYDTLHDVDRGLAL